MDYKQAINYLQGDMAACKELVEEVGDYGKGFYTNKIEAYGMAIDALEKTEHKTTPKEFAEKMAKAQEGSDYEESHIESDELMCNLLKELGYGEGVEIFEESPRYYC